MLAPFLAFLALFLVYPTVTVVWSALNPDGELGISALQRATQGTYGRGFLNSITLSLTTAVIGGIIGTVLAVVVSGMKRPRWLHSGVDSWSAVASQLGGVPLGFAFIATIGAQGLLTKILGNAGVDLVEAGVSPSGFWGLTIVYLYFQIPLMFLVTVPALNGLRPTWKEAAAILGGRPYQYWVRVAIPVLTPTVIGGMLLLFVNSFAAYATAYVLDPSRALVPLQIRFLLQGNIISGEEDLGNAIVTLVILLLITSLALITWLQRRTSRWTT